MQIEEEGARFKMRRGARCRGKRLIGRYQGKHDASAGQRTCGRIGAADAPAAVILPFCRADGFRGIGRLDVEGVGLKAEGFPPAFHESGRGLTEANQRNPGGRSLWGLHAV